MTDKILAEKEGSLGWLIINNPERRNAMSQDMWQAVEKVVEDFGQDPAIRVVVLKGAGDRAFISGADISQFEKIRNSAEAEAAYAAITREARRKLKALLKPTIAMINGFCIGGGMETALSCDLRIASENSSFGIPAARLGLAYGPESVSSLLAVVGAGYAREIIITGRRFSASEALHMGLVHHVMDFESLEPFVREQAALIAENAPLTLASFKTVIGELLKNPAERDTAAMDASLKRCFDSEDFQEGRRSFMAKRTPVFQGK